MSSLLEYNLSFLFSLDLEWISKSNMKQRAGRAGRSQPGVCFHLFSEAKAKRYALQSFY